MLDRSDDTPTRRGNGSSPSPHLKPATGTYSRIDMGNVPCMSVVNCQPASSDNLRYFLANEACTTDNCGFSRGRLECAENMTSKVDHIVISTVLSLSCIPDYRAKLVAESLLSKSNNRDDVVLWVQQICPASPVTVACLVWVLGLCPTYPFNTSSYSREL